MGQGKDKSQRKRRAKAVVEADRQRAEEQLEAARANSRRFFGRVPQQDGPWEESAPPIPEDPPAPQPHMMSQQDRSLAIPNAPMEVPPLPEAELEVTSDHDTMEVANPPAKGLTAPETRADVKIAAPEENFDDFGTGIDSVDLSGVPVFFQGYVRKQMAEFRSWWKISGNQHSCRIKGTWKWKSMEVPYEDPNIVECAGPLEYLVPRFCKVQFYMPDLFFTFDFPNRRMPCKYHGWDSDCCQRLNFFNPEGPRLVTEVDGTLRLTFCSTFVCKTLRKHKQTESREKYTFRGYDPEFLADKMPAHIRKSLNCVITKKAAVSVALLEDVERALLTSQASFLSQSGVLKETLKSSFYATEHEYWSSKSHRVKRRKIDGQGTLGQLWSGYDPEKPERFPDIDEIIPDRAYITGRVLCELFGKRSQDQHGFFELHMQLTDTLYLKGDKSFKVTKMIFTKGGTTSKAFDAVYTVMNQNGEIVAQYFTRTNSPQELKDIHAAIKKRMKLHGFPDVKLMWVDDCCHEYDSIADPFPELCDGRKETKNEMVQQPISTLERFSVCSELGDAEPRYITSISALATYASDLARQQQQNKDRGCTSYLSMDCEWNEEDISPEDPKTMQVAMNDGPSLNRHLVAFIPLELITEGNTIQLPHSFKAALAEPNTLLVGVSVQLDINNLNHHYDDLVGNPGKRKRDLGTWARSLGVVLRGGSLQLLTALLLSKFLDKESDIRCSDWSTSEHSDRQREYALCDAIAGIQIALGLERLEKVHRKPNAAVPGEFVVGRTYRLFNKTGSGFVALGQITDILPQQKCRVKLLKIVQPSSKPWLGNPNKKTLSNYGLGNDAEWPLKRMKFASAEEEETVLDESMAAATNATETPSDSQEDGSAPNEGDTNDVVELPQGIDLNSYPENHNGERTNRGEAAAPRQSSGPRRSRPKQRQRRNWKRIRIKLDIFHAKKRLKDTVKKSHGCYNHFCQLVSDAFFITNPDDWEKQRQKLITRLQRHGYVDVAKVRSELKRNRAKYEQNCRRSVPEPDVLEARLKAVVELFGNVEDAKTGEKFFSKKTWDAYKALVKHVRKGCLSDDPRTNHYYMAGGKLFCIRGTNALEGYHRALRRVIQQYHSTPELCIHILSAFNYRWNIDRKADRELLPAKYAKFYKHYQIEEIQEMTYDFYDEPVHPEWNSSKGVASSGEVFYWPMDGSMNTTDNTNEDEEEEGPISHVPFQNISTAYERELFDGKVASFYRRNTSGSASENPSVMYDTHDWSAFQIWWDGKVKWNEGLPLHDRKAIFRKTAAVLKQYYAASQRRVNRDATLSQASLSGGTIADQARTLTESFRNATGQGVFHPMEQPTPVARPEVADAAGVPVGVPPIELAGASAANRLAIASIAANYKHIGSAIPDWGDANPRSQKRQVYMCKRCGLIKKGEGHEGGSRKNSIKYCSIRANWYPTDRIPEEYRCIE